MVKSPWFTQIFTRPNVCGETSNQPSDLDNIYSLQHILHGYRVDTTISGKIGKVPPRVITARDFPGTGFWGKMLEKTSRVITQIDEYQLNFGIENQIEFDKLNK